MGGGGETIPSSEQQELLTEEVLSWGGITL